MHEVAQELSDFAILVSPTQGGLRPIAALALNIASGLSVVLGTVVVLATDVSSLSTGLIRPIKVVAYCLASFAR
jgi:hypothetical protein